MREKCIIVVFLMVDDPYPTCDRFRCIKMFLRLLDEPEIPPQPVLMCSHFFEVPVKKNLLPSLPAPGSSRCGHKNSEAMVAMVDRFTPDS